MDGVSAVSVEIIKLVVDKTFCRGKGAYLSLANYQSCY